MTNAQIAVILNEIAHAKKAIEKVYETQERTAAEHRAAYERLEVAITARLEGLDARTEQLEISKAKAYGALLLVGFTVTLYAAIRIFVDALEVI